MYQRLAYSRGEEVGEEEEEERDRRRGDVRGGMVKCDVVVGPNLVLCVSAGLFMGVCVFACDVWIIYLFMFISLCVFLYFKPKWL